MEGLSALNDRLQVCEYSEELLLRILKRILRNTHIDIQSLRKKAQVAYLNGYLVNEEAKTIVIESQYVDRHFLEDYSNYHVRSFSDYGKLCTRIHFFDKKAHIETPEDREHFYRGDFIEFLKGRPANMSSESLEDGYLGFSVIRPLRDAFIGRTCLRTYKEGSHVQSSKTSQVNTKQRTDRRRFYKSVKPEQVNLFGLTLNIPTTLPFQEQDSSVAACASSALWSFFHGTNASSRRQVPSPSEITKIAEAKGAIGSQRLTGVHGLTPSLMRNAISAFDLEYLEYCIAESSQLFKEIVYAYQCEKKEPLLLGVDVYERRVVTDSANQEGVETEYEWDLVDGHLITITGYEISQSIYEDPPLATDSDASLCYRSVAASMTKIYCHDDQLGPFARFDIETKQEHKLIDSDYAGDGIVLKPTIKSEDPAGASLVDNTLYVPRTLHLGVYHKIRNDFTSARSASALLNTAIINLIEQTPKGQDRGIDDFWEKNKIISWELSLCNQNFYKASVLDSQFALNAELVNQNFDLLISRLPRFIWRLTCFSAGERKFDVLLDATSAISNGAMERSVSNGVLDVIYFSLDWKSNIEKSWELVSEVPNTVIPGATISLSDDVSRFWTSFLSPRSEFNYLDELYGDLAFPTSINPWEVRADKEFNKSDETYIIYFNDRSSLEFSLANFEKNRTYNWLVDEFGNLHIGRLDIVGPMELGHPTLINGEQARIAGELKYSGGCWIISNQSGRYSVDKDNRIKAHIDAVVQFMMQRGLISALSDIKIDFSSKYSSAAIRSFAGFSKSLKLDNLDNGEFEYYAIETAIAQLNGVGAEEDARHMFLIFKELCEFVREVEFRAITLRSGATRCLTSIEILGGKLINSELLPDVDKVAVAKSVREIVDYCKRFDALANDQYCDGLFIRLSRISAEM